MGFEKKENFMKNYIKKIVKKILNLTPLYPSIRKYKILLYKEKFTDSHQNFFKKILLFFQVLFKTRIIAIFGKKELIEKKAILFLKKCRKIKLSISPTDKFIYNVDPFILPMYFIGKEKLIIGNLAINYDKILRKGVVEIEKEIVQKLKETGLDRTQRTFLNSLLKICRGIRILAKRYVKELAKFKAECSQNIKEIQDTLTQVPLYQTRNFRDALQSILFVNSLIWLDDHCLVGVGRLDQILYPYFKADFEAGLLTKNEAYNLLKEFLRALHRGYKYKSNMLLGDTGQVIVLGGKNMDGSDASNELTFMIIDALKELRLPDPKIILRVHSKTPDALWHKALECLLSGLQYPLFSNDEVIIPTLIKFGYLKEDAFNYGTSACWEPLILGKSLDQNNLSTINFLTPLQETIEEIKKESLEIKNFSDFLALYKKNLSLYVRKEIEKLNEIEFEPAPLLSLLVDDCLENSKDISEGGAKYNNYGILSVGLGNTINALFNIERIVFEEKKYSFSDLLQAMKKNFFGYEILLENLKRRGVKFCMDNKKVVSLVNEVIETVSQVLKNFSNKFGGKFKFGLSSPAFVSFGKDSPASLDGRKCGEALGVNISPLPSNPSLSYTEILSFASKINYEKAFNGAVLDLMVERGLVENNREKFISLLKTFFEMGGMQLQLNILDFRTLIAARKNPDLFPELIVRVWGFCAYFKDLPEEYQNLIIERAKHYEFACGKYSEI